MTRFPRGSYIALLAVFVLASALAIDVLLHLMDAARAGGLAEASVLAWLVTITGACGAYLWNDATDLR